MSALEEKWLRAMAFSMLPGLEEQMARTDEDILYAVRGLDHWVAEDFANYIQLKRQGWQDRLDDKIEELRTTLPVLRNIVGSVRRYAVTDAIRLIDKSPAVTWTGKGGVKERLEIFAAEQEKR